MFGIIMACGDSGMTVMMLRRQVLERQASLSSHSMELDSEAKSRGTFDGN
jgi:hypothetical protein